MLRTLLGGILVAPGTVVILLSALADPIGLGSEAPASAGSRRSGSWSGRSSWPSAQSSSVRAPREPETESPADTA